MYKIAKIVRNSFFQEIILQVPVNATTLLEAQLSNEDPLFKFYWAQCQKAQKIGDLVILCGFIQKFLLKSL